MAEAVRVKTRTPKKRVCQTRLVEKKEKPSEEEKALDDFMKNEYENTDLPELDIKERKQDLKKCETENAVEEENLAKSGKENIAGEDTAPDEIRDCEELECEQGDTGSRHIEEHAASAPMPPEQLTYEQLNCQLDTMEPYLKVQQQLKQLQLYDPGGDCVASAPSASMMEGELEQVSPSENAEAHRYDYTVIPSAPVFSGTQVIVAENDPVPVEGKEDFEKRVLLRVPLHRETHIEQYSDIQLSGLYQNQLLENNEKFITEFIDDCKSLSSHELYELVLSYLRSRTGLVGCNKEVSVMLDDYKNHSKSIWVFEKRTVKEEGECEDGKLLTVKHEYEVASFKEDISAHVHKLLKQCRDRIFDAYALHAYTAEMSKLQVENYLYKILSACPEFSRLPTSAPVQAFTSSQQMQHIKIYIDEIKICISILFHFQRRDVQDKQFVKDTRQWLTDLVGILLRVASLHDHLFLLNHILRCPAGVGNWAASFIQVPWPTLHPNQSMFGSSYLDHAVTILATVLMPARGREDFLHHLRTSFNVDKDGGSDGQDNVWVVVDSSGEEDEDPRQLWLNFQESDIVQVRYRGVVKRLSRLIRHIVHHVTDHWQNFITYHSNSMDGEVDQAFLVRLQVEYDAFFERAVESIFSSQRSGAWQFLAVIPYSSVSLEKLWKILYCLHVGSLSCEEGQVRRSNEEWEALLVHEDTRGRFHDGLLKRGDNEAFYLLTTFANMASARDATEHSLIQVVVHNVFDLGFICEETRELCSKSGRDLLAGVAAKHPFIISSLLTLTQEKLSHVGGLCHYLFRALPLHIWVPSEDDIGCVSYWLLYAPPGSVESQLARIVTQGLNWGDRADGSDLFLPKSLHLRIALVIVEAHLKLCWDAGQGGLLSEGVKQVTAVMYAPSHQQVLSDWIWSMLGRLRLHALDQPQTKVIAALRTPGVILYQVPDPTTSPVLDVVKQGIRENQPIALFFCILISTWGHSLPEFCGRGLETLHLLVTRGHYTAAIHCLHHVTPLFFPEPEDLVSDTKFIGIIQALLGADQSYLKKAKDLIAPDTPGKFLQLFAAMIHTHIVNYQRYGWEDSTQVVHFWLSVLTCIPHWTRDTGVLHVVNMICQHAILAPASLQAVFDVFRDIMKTLEPQRGQTGSWSSLLSWMTSGASAPHSLLVRPSAPDLPWFAFVVLTLEMQEEMGSRLWKKLLVELQHEPQQSIDAALKTVCNELEIPPVPSALLCLYRWGQQVIDLPIEHPALLPSLQMFFTLHLARAPTQSGQYDHRSVIHLFYEGIINSAFLNKIKRKVNDAHELFKKKCSEETMLYKESIEEACDKRKQHWEASVRLVHAMTFWLEEKKLYDSTLYIPALPPHFLATYLLHIFQENLEIWPEAIDMYTFTQESEKLIRLWQQQRGKSQMHRISPTSSPFHESSLGHEGAVNESLSPTQRILKRLSTYDQPLPAPSVVPIRPLMPKITKKALQDETSLFYDVDRYTEIIRDHAHMMMLAWREVCALDCVYNELLPQQWTNPECKKVVMAACQPPKRGKTQEDCTGPASIVIEFEEARLNEGVNAHLEQNRGQHKSLVQNALRPPPLTLCQAALHLEALITLMVKIHGEESGTNGNLLKLGRTLFYRILQLSSEETQSYPPAQQLISSCAEVLGQEFFRGHEDCQEEILENVFVVAKDNLGGMLAPHFSPLSASSNTVLRLYSVLAPHATSNPDLTFTLMSKFDVERWLKERNPSHAERKELLNSALQGLASLGCEVENDKLIVLELLRVHVKAVLQYQFPDHYWQILDELLLLSSNAVEKKGSVHMGVWYDLINVVAGGVVTFKPGMTFQESVNAVSTFSRSQTLFTFSLAKDTLSKLSNYFVTQRLEFGLYGLYPKYRPFIEPLSLLLGSVSSTYLVKRLQMERGKASADEITAEMWAAMEGLWAAWVAPLGGKARESCPAWLQQLTHDRKLLLPWVPDDAQLASKMVFMFIHAIQLIHSLLPSANRSVMSYVLEFYGTTFACREVKDYVLNIIHHHFECLPWQHFRPSLQDIEMLNKIVDQYLPECHSFVGKIFVQIQWKVVMHNFMPVQSDSGDATCYPVLDSAKEHEATRAHVCILNLFSALTLEPVTRQSEKLETLLAEAREYSWHLLDGPSFENIIYWFLNGCDARIVLDQKGRNPIDVAILELLHVAAGYNPDVKQFHPDTLGKRCLLVRSLVRQICVVACRYKALLSSRSHLFLTTIVNLLNHMENTLINTVPPAQQFTEASALINEVMTLLGTGHYASIDLQMLSNKALINWLVGHHPTTNLLLPFLSVTSRTIHKIAYRNPLLEHTMRALFECTGPPDTCSSGASEVRVSSSSDTCLIGEQVSWPVIMKLLEVPVATDPSHMLELAMEAKHYLVIYTHTRWRRQFYVSIEEELANFTILCDLITNSNTIPDEETEKGSLLLLSELCDLIWRQVDMVGDLRVTWLHANNLAQVLCTWAEDKQTSGLLGAIGLGKQSPLSPRVRLVCRALGCFLLAQMPAPRVFRSVGGSPAAVSMYKADDSAEMQASEEAMTALQRLMSLRTNSLYAPLLPSLEWSIEFVLDPAHTIRHAGVLLQALIGDLFHEKLLQHIAIKRPT
ncbi:ectopic P-granules autophagy protein 5 isoform X2 [Oratosquilla oratoria]|uniref:ectopic P-granules autophagy protein 5 isoform X2 n=1 Tax=Oratosquilla oratoria TaxID=337810 RepID=UPI003F75B471